MTVPCKMSDLPSIVKDRFQTGQQLMPNRLELISGSLDKVLERAGLEPDDEVT